MSAVEDRLSKVNKFSPCKMDKNNPRHAVAQCNAPRGLKLKDMDEKNMHNLFLKNMAGLIEETKNPSPCLNP